MSDDDLLDVRYADGQWYHLESHANEHAALASVDQWNALMKADNWPAFEFAAYLNGVYGRFVGTLAYLEAKAEQTKANRHNSNNTGGDLGTVSKKKRLAQRILAILSTNKWMTREQLTKATGKPSEQILLCLRKLTASGRLEYADGRWRKPKRELFLFN